ncbi:MAG TPA: ATP-dependent DNA ligase [Methylomirabilota bacterium]|jgi:ATP-dependent DNA ligase|nr:ATP-dependent DNA ligase [Methylomirabilota bacterium]
MASRGGGRARRDVAAGAVPAGDVGAAEFPPIDLELRPPYPPMEAQAVGEIPEGEGWLYEPKWDGFRCVAFRSGQDVALQSKSGQPLGRYFPELVTAMRALPLDRVVLDGEIVIFSDGALDFDALLQRIHPADSRIRKLAAETPTTFLVFDLLIDETGRVLTGEPLQERRAHLERLFQRLPEGGTVRLSPATRDRAVAERWMRELGAAGLDGVVAKRADVDYRSGDRTGMRKVKRLRTIDCVVGGFRYLQAGREVGSLLLGLYDDEGLLNHVGFCASFTAEERRTLKPLLEPLVEPPGFTGSAPGGPSRWSAGRNTEWQPLRPSLVCEVRYDHFSGGRFRHGAKFVRWRPDKKPEQCTDAQIAPGGGGSDALDRLGVGTRAGGAA